MVPAIRCVAIHSGRHPNIEARSQSANSAVDVTIDALLGLRAFRPAKLAGWFVQMLVIEAKLHRSHNDIQSLEDYVVVR